jgi:hypothetical protein
LHEESKARFDVPPIVDQTQEPDASHGQPGSNGQSTGNPGHNACNGNSESPCPWCHLGMTAPTVGSVDKPYVGTICRDKKANAERHEASAYRPSE